MKYNGIECNFNKIKDYNKPNEFNAEMNMVQKYFNDIQIRHNEYMKIKAFELIERKKKNPYNGEKYILFYTTHDISNNSSNISFIDCSETAETYEEAIMAQSVLQKNGIYSSIYKLKPSMVFEGYRSENTNSYEELKQRLFKQDPELKEEYDKLDDEDIEDEDEDEDEYEDPSEREWVKADELYDEIKSGYIDKGEVK